MAKYMFRVYLHNGVEDVVPSGLPGTDLHDLDKFVFDCGSYSHFLRSLANEFGLRVEDITKVGIYRVKKNIEFKVPFNNTYLNSALNALTTKKVVGLHGNRIDAVVVPNTSPSYIEMKKFLLSNIGNNSFFSDIYTYNNQFQRLLIEYSQALKTNFDNLEDVLNFEELKRRVENELSIYKNYRGLCLARKKYEDNLRKSSDIKSSIYVSSQFPTDNISLHPLTKDEIEKINHQARINQINQYVNLIGEEKEEFLEVDELDIVHNYR